MRQLSIGFCFVMSFVWLFLWEKELSAIWTVGMVILANMPERKSH